MEPSSAVRSRSEFRPRAEGIVGSAKPLVRPAPRSAMFFPLVVLVAVLPGLYALNSWDLTPPGPWWGLRGLAVIDGMVLDQVPAVAELKPYHEASAYRTVAFQPPLYAWLEAIGLRLTADRNPLGTVLPSYVAGALIVVLVYLHGRLWGGPGMGLAAAVLTGLNRGLLLQMQQATPTTLAVVGTLGVLLCYGRHLRVINESSRWGAWGGGVVWALLGGLALGVSLMAVGLIGLICVPVVLLHQAYLRAGSPPAERAGHPWWLAWRHSPTLLAGSLAIAVALLVAAPWQIAMFTRYGFDALGALLAPFDPHSHENTGLLTRLIGLAPATLPLGIYGAARMGRLALTDESNDPGIVGGVLWVMWLAVAAVVPVFWPAGPRPVIDLFLLVPLNLLAARTIIDLANRRISVRTLTWLAPATAASIAWWASADLREAVSNLAHGRAGASTALGLHLALDLLVVAFWLTRRLDHWARRRDDRQRWVLAGFLACVMAVIVTAGTREVSFRHRETDDLLLLRTMILRHDREKPFNLVAVVGPDPARLRSEGPAPGGRLRFILRTALPGLPQRDLTSTEELLSLPEGQRLVILAGTDQRLSRAIQSQLGLEVIHPGRSGILDAFATAGDRVRPPRR